MKVRILGIIVCIVVILSFSLVQGAETKYPSKEINYIIAFNPGGESDIEFRIMQPFIEKSFGVRFIPDYKPAAGGAMAWGFIMAGKPDGYTIAGFNSPHIITQPLTMKDVKFQPMDFTYLGMIENTPITICVKKGFPAKTLKEFIDYAKANPGKVTVGAVGKFSGHHLAAVQFMKMTGTKVVYIPYDGTGSLKPSIMGGHVDAVFTNSPAAVEMKSMGITPLAVGTEKRMKQLPDVPTFAELGYKFYPRIDRGIIAPKGLPKDVLEKLDKKLFEIVSNKEVQAKLVEGGFVPNPMNSAQATKYMSEQAAAIKKLVEEEGLLQTKK
ncbi:MAG: tripartite tricarboxylate transporter substrate binding protein [Syntrophales bacterium LBB04]|nr:tripartite tricarboxylate transporter substrate binding protein [Syntrophales bacterium LBB04]